MGITTTSRNSLTNIGACSLAEAKAFMTEARAAFLSAVDERSAGEITAEELAYAQAYKTYTFTVYIKAVHGDFSPTFNAALYRANIKRA